MKQISVWQSSLAPARQSLPLAKESRACSMLAGSTPTCFAGCSISNSPRLRLWARRKTASINVASRKCHARFSKSHPSINPKLLPENYAIQHPESAPLASPQVASLHRVRRQCGQFTNSRRADHSAPRPGFALWLYGVVYVATIRRCRQGRWLTPLSHRDANGPRRDVAPCCQPNDQRTRLKRRSVAFHPGQVDRQARAY